MQVLSSLLLGKYCLLEGLNGIKFDSLKAIEVSIRLDLHFEAGIFLCGNPVDFLAKDGQGSLFEDFHERPVPEILLRHLHRVLNIPLNLLPLLAEVILPQELVQVDFEDLVLLHIGSILDYVHGRVADCVLFDFSLFEESGILFHRHFLSWLAGGSVKDPSSGVVAACGFLF